MPEQSQTSSSEAGVDLKLEDLPNDLARDVFQFVIAQTRWAIGLGLVFILFTGAGLLQLVKDPSTDSLIPPDHDSVLTRDYAEEVFGLRDPVVAAIVSEAPDGIFTQDALHKLFELHTAIENLENVRSDRTVSLVSEAEIIGEDDALRVETFLPEPPQSEAEVERILASVDRTDLIEGVLISEDRTTAIVVAELLDQSKAEQTYQETLAIAEQLATDAIKIHVAGQGAVSGYLSGSIDRDSRKLPPICVALIFCLIWLAFRSGKALLAPLLVLAATVAGAIGIMAWAGISYFVITTSLPVILITVAVADTIHILSGYYRRLSVAPDHPRREVVVEVMVDLWRPLTLTTFTTMAGFIGIGLASSMPPISYFGWFAALGVFIAWVFSILVLPCVLAFLQPGPSPVLRQDGPGIFSGTFSWLAGQSAKAPGRTLAIVGLLASLALIAATNVKVERSQIENFPDDQAIRLADELINEKLAGTSYLDIIVETDEVDGLLVTDRIHSIAELQTFAETLPFVQKTHSVADTLRELHRTLDPSSTEPLPHDDAAIAQYLLFYEASASAEDLEDEIDLNFQRALVRLYMNSRYTGEEAEAVDALTTYLTASFNTDGMNARLSGRVNVDYHWMKQLKDGHIRSILLSAFLVFLVAAILFRSILFGLMALAPVGAAILGVYSVMGATNIFIEPATSMFAAISIGIGVDFAIHFTDRFQKGRRNGLTVLDVIKSEFPTSTRACAINAAALGIGFSVLMTSELPPIFKFGLLITIAAAASFIGGLIVISSIFGLIERHSLPTVPAPVKAVGLSMVMIGMLNTGEHGLNANAQPTLTGPEIAERVYGRDEGQRINRRIKMELTDRRGLTREREAISRRLNDDGVKKSVIVYTAPRRYRNVAFLTHDPQGEGQERRWLYMPATGRPKQIPSSDRGDYFLGTEFSYEDIRTELKFDLDDYSFDLCDPDIELQTGQVCVIAKPTNEATANEIGYGRILAVIDTQSWIPLEIDFDDQNGQALKTVRVSEVHLVDDVWTPTRIHVDHHQNGRSTTFNYEDISYSADLDTVDFTPQGLKRLLN